MAPHFLQVEQVLQGLLLGTSFPYIRKDAEWLLRELVFHHPGSVPVVVSGSTCFAYEEREQMFAGAEGVGRLLASHPLFLPITGGMSGVGEYTAQHFAGSRGGEANGLYHVLPVDVHKMFGLQIPPHGITHYLGTSFFERQVLLGLSTRLLIVIGGGSGTAREANTALAGGAVVLPLVNTGGVSGGLHFDREDERDAGLDLSLLMKRAVDETGLLTVSQWHLLTSPTATPGDVLDVLDQVLRRIESLG